MPAYLRIGDIQGEATDRDHQAWVIIETMSSAVYRSIPRGARDVERVRGRTVLADVVIVRELDRSSIKLQEACASGKFFPEVEVHLCTTVQNRQEPYLKYLLKDVIVTSYSFHGIASGDLLPAEEVTLDFTEVEWTYIVVDPRTGEKKGNVPGKYNPGTG